MPQNASKTVDDRKGLKKTQNILDHMGSTELAANLFRTTQTDNETHYAVGKEVRETIGRLGGTMPEDLPTPDKSIKQIEKEQKKLIDSDE